MLVRLDPREKAQLFRFDATDCLYRDHLGRRVIADVEGFGTFRTEGVELDIEIDGEPAQAISGSFCESLLIGSRQEGQVSVWVCSGGLDPINSNPTFVDVPYSGSGWLVEARNCLIVDDRGERAPVPARTFPVPFFRRIEGTDQVGIIPSAPMTCEEIDCFSIADEAALAARRFAVQNISKRTVLESRFGDGTVFQCPTASHLNRASWVVDLPAAIDGLIIRKTYDRFHGRQRARVLVDGAFTGWWYEPNEDRVNRWARADYGIPAEHIRGKSQLEVAVDPPAGTPLWSVATIQVFALRYL